MGGADAKPTAETRTATLTLEDDRLLLVSIKPGCEITLEDVKEINAARERLAGEDRLRVLVDAQHIRSVSRQAREYQADADTRRHTVAQAMVVGSPTSRVVGNFLIGLNRPPCPVKLFTNMDKAVAWLRGFEL